MSRPTESIGTSPPQQAYRAALNVRDAAIYLGVTEGSLNTWRSRGIGPASTRIGGRVLYRITVLDQYLIDKER